MDIKKQPVSNVKWVRYQDLTANDYNPNRVANSELKLLKISIMEDGWTQPIVINPDYEIVDGYHRWTVAQDKDMLKRFGDLVPTVMTAPSTLESQKMSTIRHNRARGIHSVLDMAKIVGSMVEDGTPMKEIMYLLQMEEEEVIRLVQRVGIPKSQIIKDTEFSKAWEV